MATKKVIQVQNEDGKYVGYYGEERIGASNKPTYFAIALERQEHSKILRFKMTPNNTDIVFVDGEPAELAVKASSIKEPQDNVKTFDFSVNERFEIMDQLTRMVVNRSIPSLLITGDGGLGKTYTVMDNIKKSGQVNCDVKADLNQEILDVVCMTKGERAKALAAEKRWIRYNEGLEDDNEEDDEEMEAMEKPVDPETTDGVPNKLLEYFTNDGNALTPAHNLQGDYVVIKGYSSARALYDLIYFYHNKTIIFDDCDSVLKDQNALNIIKGALDSYETRTVSWNTNLGSSGSIPTRMEFTGQIIFISNRSKSQIDNAIRSRCQNVDLTMTKDEKIERMEYIAPNMDGFKAPIKKEALKFIKQHIEYIPDRNMNLRTLVNLCKVIISTPDGNWERTAKYTLQA